MTGPTTLTSEMNMWLTAFKRAYEAPGGQQDIPCENLREANRVRIALYRVKKQFLAREELRTEYPDFLTACQDTSISFNPKTGKLMIYRTDASDFNKRMMKLLGIGEEGNQLAVSKSARESEERFKKLLVQEDEKPVFNNPFADVLKED
jgi:hypothetical protein